MQEAGSYKRQTWLIDTTEAQLRFLPKVFTLPSTSSLPFLTFFSLLLLEGRLHQVEYAIEAINNAGTCVGLVASDGIILGGKCSFLSVD